MMKTKTKLTGLALVIGGCVVDNLMHGLARREVIEYVPQMYELASHFSMVTGSYIIGKTYAYERYMSRFNDYLYEGGATTRARENRVKRWL